MQRPTSAAAPAVPAVPIAPTVTTWRCAAGGVFALDCSRPTVRPLASVATNAPGAPASLTSSVTGSTVQLTWTAPSAGAAASSYVVEAGSASGLIDLANFDTGNAAVTLTVTSVPAGSYFVRVRAKTSAGSGNASNEVILTVAGGACTTAPGAPTGLAATVSGTSVSLSWRAAIAGCTPTGYVLEAGSASGLSNLANVNTGSPVTSFSASGIAPGTYFVRVRAGNDVGSSAASNEVTFATSVPPCTAPSAPFTVSAATNGATVTIAWGAASGSPTSYVVDVGTSSGASNVASQDTGSTATSLSSTMSPGIYFARVRAVNACGTSAASNEVAFTITAPPCPAPSAPSGLTASVSGTTVTVSWTAASGAPTSYRVEIGTVSGSSNVSSTDTGSTATSASTSLSAATYFIRVKAVNACGASGASNEATATTTSTPTPAVITITSSGVSPKNLTVSPGTQVTFVNNDQIIHDMTSNPHPEHTDCPELNQVGFLVPGQSRQTGNLNSIRTCGYHDHSNAFNTAMQGTITIR